MIDSEEYPYSMLVLPEGAMLSDLKALLDEVLGNGFNAVLREDTVIYLKNIKLLKPEEVN